MSRKTKTQENPVANEKNATKADPETSKQPADNTALQTKGETAIEEFDFGDSAGKGRETVTSAMIKIPILRLLQKTTPGIDEEEVRKKYGPLFAPGNFQNPVTGKCYDGKAGLHMQMVALGHIFIEWEPDQNGLVDKHDPDSEVVEAAKKDAKAKGLEFGEFYVGDNELVEHLEAMTILTDPATGERFMAQVSVKSTGIPPYQNYVSTIMSNGQLPNGQYVDPNTIPLFAYVGLITSEFQKSDKYTWFRPVFAPVNGDASKSILPRSSPKFKDAEGLYKSFNKGDVVVDDSTRDRAKAATTDGGGSNNAAPKPNAAAGAPGVTF